MITSFDFKSDATIYAKWTAIPKYSITFNTDGGTPIAPVEDYRDTEIDLTKNEYKPTKDGHTFTGWVDENGDPVTKVTLGEDITVKATWSTNAYTLKFVTNCDDTIADVVKEFGTVIDLTADYLIPVRESYRFDGWYEEDGLVNPIESLTLIGDKTVYAKWVKLYTLTFVSNKGSEISPVTDDEGTVIDLTLEEYVPERRNYKFKGWYSDEKLKNQVESVTLDSDITVYAKWQSTGGSGGGGTIIKYEITFEVNGGEVLEKAEKHLHSTVDLSKYTPVREGYEFEGWYTDAELTNKVTKIIIEGDITLYAKWEKLEDGEEGETVKPNYKPDILTDEHIAYIVGRDDGYIRPQYNLTRAEAATIFFRLLDEDVRSAALTTENQFVDVNEGDWFNTAVSTLANLEVLVGRTVDSFAPNEQITRAELTTIVARLSEASYDGENLFTDIDGHWAEDYINIAASIGWVQGDGDGTFRPKDSITRAEVMTLVNRALNRQPESKDDLLEGMTKWPDNSNEDKWYYLAIQEATNSHKYEMKADGVHESWTRLTETPDWLAFEE